MAFDWTLDLLFPKDVCAVYDLDQHGRDFGRLDYARHSFRSKDDYKSVARELVRSSAGNGLTTTDPVGAGGG